MNTTDSEVTSRRRGLPAAVWIVVGLVVGAAIASLVLLSPIGHGLHGGTASASASDQKELWTCPMHPQILEDHPGSCPICGMDLVPVADQASTASDEHPMPDDGGPVVTVDPKVVQRMNVTTTTLERRDLRRAVRTVGSLDYDQEHMVTVTTKYPGFVEKLYVRSVGEPIEEGQPLFDVYAPELVQTQQELLSAMAYATRLEGAPEATRARADALVAAARQRLAFWDIGPDQVAKIIASGEPIRALTVRAPASGLVMQLAHGLEGMRIQPGMDVIHIAGIDPLWLRVEVFDDQLAWIGPGSPAKVSLSYLPGESFTARVRYIEPEVAEKTRTVQLVLEVANPSGKLRVGMYATVELEATVVRNAVAVPTQAVLRTGDRSIVVEALGDGRFVPRVVELGLEADGYLQVLSGLDSGTEIVTSSQFLIDSESNLRAAISKLSDQPSMEGGSHGTH